MLLRRGRVSAGPLLGCKMASPTTDALIRVDGGLKWRGEQCYNFNVTDNMKRKFSSETIFKVNATDDFVLDNEIFD